jgi:hypothetical protein
MEEVRAEREAYASVIEARYMFARVQKEASKVGE